MQTPDFKKLDRRFIVICFLQEDDFSKNRNDLEQLGNQRNLTLVVQPCPYEGIEFLNQLEDDLWAHLSISDPFVLWKALVLKPDCAADTISAIRDDFHAYYLAVLNQEADQVQALASKLKSYSNDYFES